MYLCIFSVSLIDNRESDHFLGQILLVTDIVHGGVNSLPLVQKRHVIHARGTATDHLDV